jgi:hypothetical protein
MRLRRCAIRVALFGDYVLEHNNAHSRADIFLRPCRSRACTNHRKYVNRGSDRPTERTHEALHHLVPLTAAYYAHPVAVAQYQFARGSQNRRCSDRLTSSGWTVGEQFRGLWNAKQIAEVLPRTRAAPKVNMNELQSDKISSGEGDSDDAPGPRGLFIHGRVSVCCSAPKLDGVRQMK